MISSWVISVKACCMRYNSFINPQYWLVLMSITKEWRKQSFTPRMLVRFGGNEEARKFEYSCWLFSKEYKGSEDLSSYEKWFRFGHTAYKRKRLVRCTEYFHWVSTEKKFPRDLPMYIGRSSIFHEILEIPKHRRDH